ncbi:MAG: protoporphyrinogen oxidase HemJ [Pseudomonadota bacterium]|nr:protoporphyrinogen oxidase HemJ [Pseudomonadota bacterium]
MDTIRCVTTSRREIATLYLWLKAFHIISVITWFAGIFYLPRLFVYHSACEDEISSERFKVMERKLYRLIMTPSMVITLTLGFGMLAMAWQGLSVQSWIWIKIALVGLLVAYHLHCGWIIREFAARTQNRSEKFFRIYNELPVLILVPVILLVVLQPF